jgi:hypothetical protein
MPKHYENDKAPKMPPKVDNSYKKKDVFETKQEQAKQNKKPKKSTKKKYRKE